MAQALRRTPAAADPVRLQRVMRCPDDADDLFVTHDFPTAEQAGSFAHDPALRTGMQQAGVEGKPQIEIFTDV